MLKRLILWMMAILLAVSAPIAQVAAEEEESSEPVLQETSSEEDSGEEESTPVEEEITSDEPASEEELVPEEEETSEEELPEEESSAAEEATEEVSSPVEEATKEESSPAEETTEEESSLVEEEMEEEEPAPAPEEAFEEDPVITEEELPEEELLSDEDEIPEGEPFEEEAASEEEALPEIVDHLASPPNIKYTLISGQRYGFTYQAGEVLYYKFVPEETAFYTLQSMNTAETVGIIYDEEMVRLDFVSGDPDFSIRIQLEAGKTYYYRIQFLNSDDSGILHFLLRKTNPGWNLNNDVWYYYNQDGNPVIGTKEIGNYTYAFDAEGGMIVDSTFQENYDVFFFDSKGHMVKEEGWVKTKYGDYYYINAYGTCHYGWLEYKNKKYYLFPQMYKDSPGWVDDELYYFMADGALLEKAGWFKSDWGQWYYVKNNTGALAIGLQTIGGYQYYFDDYGVMYQSCTVRDQNDADVFYVADASGHVTKVKNGWNKAGDRYCYFKEGRPVEDDILMIGGAWYGFSDDGFMFDGTEFEYYSDMYRAALGGKLYVNQWYSERGRKKYYGNNGAMLFDTVTMIDGKKYAFDEDGWLFVSTFYEEGGKTYYADSDGVLSDLSIGWNRIDGNYYYYDPSYGLSKDTIEKIDGKLYGFSESGVMYNNERFWMGNIYMAAKGGALYENQWVKFGSNWFYFGENGAAQEGMTTIDGNIYYFMNGMMSTDMYLTKSNQLYYCNAKGIVSPVTQDGLYQNQSNYEFYYVSGGKLLTNSWKKIGGKWYYFDSYGEGLSDITSQIDGKFYYFDSNGVMQSNGWIYVDQDRIYYANASGVLLTGEQKIDGKWYYFSGDGCLMTGVVKYNGKIYLCGNDGVYIATLKNGWNQIQGAWYYLKDGSLVTNTEEYQIGSDYYAFDSNGAMMTNCICYGSIYGSNGKLVKYGWYNLNGAYYYVSFNERFVENEIVDINGKKYYFNENGVMCTSEAIVDGEYLVKCSSSGVVQSLTEIKNGWTLVDGQYYYFTGDGSPYTGWVGSYYIYKGRMVTNEIVDGYWVGKDGKYVKNTWIKPEITELPRDPLMAMRYQNAVLYAKADGKLAHYEWVKIGEDWYYFDELGFMARKALYLNGKVYQFDDSGKLVKTITSLPGNGWLKVGEDYMYFFNGAPLMYESFMMNGSMYIFDVKGLMVKNMLYEGYYIDSSGKAAAGTGWKKIDGKWYYFDRVNRYARNEFLKINGKTYGFDPYGAMITGSVVIEGVLYEFDENGALQSINAAVNGWVQSGGRWFYCNHGIMAYDEYINIGGKLYGFGADGAMLKNQALSNPDDGRTCFFGSNGVVSASEGWKKAVNGDYYYTDANGLCYKGIHTINGKTYYFNEDGKWLG